jgi:Fe-S cluster assembly protein SufD
MSIQVTPLSSDSKTASLSPAAQARAAYLTHLLTLSQQTSPSLPWLEELRNHAMLRVQEQTFPSLRDEEWRVTDLSDLLASELVEVRSAAFQATDLARFWLSEAEGCRLVFVDGIYVPEFSSSDRLPTGVTVNPLAGLAESEQQQVQSYLGKQSGSEEVFTALNTSGLSDAAVVYVRKNVVVETPIHLLFVSTASSALIQPRVLVIAEPNSALTFVEDYVSLDEAAYFTNSVTEIWLADNAQVNHTRIQRDSQAAFHIGKTAVSQDRTSRYTCTAIDLGAKLARHHLEVYQTGDQTETTLNGLTVLRGEQVGDTHSTIALTKPYGTTRQTHKCIVDDRGHAIFNGKVFVPKAAQLTDAGQLNRNLLLSSKARVDTKPQLEIVADNVKCTHGATVGQLEVDELFYLQSRGIDADSARKLLVQAFAHEIVDCIPLESLRQQIQLQVQ